MITDPAPADPDLRKTEKRSNFEWPPGLLDKVIDLFLEDAPKHIAELQAALQDKNSDILRAISHKIRGSADVLGTTSISALAMAVEEAAKSGNFEQANELTPKLVKMLQGLLIDLAKADGEEEFP